MAIEIDFICPKCRKTKREFRGAGDYYICQDCKAKQEEQKKERYKKEIRNMSDEEVRDALADLRY